MKKHLFLIIYKINCFLRFKLVSIRIGNAIKNLKERWIIVCNGRIKEIIIKKNTKSVLKKRVNKRVRSVLKTKDKCVRNVK